MEGGVTFVVMEVEVLRAEAGNVVQAPACTWMVVCSIVGLEISRLKIFMVSRFDIHVLAVLCK